MQIGTLSLNHTLLKRQSASSFGGVDCPHVAVAINSHVISLFVQNQRHWRDCTHRVLTVQVFHQRFCCSDILLTMKIL